MPNTVDRERPDRLEIHMGGYFGPSYAVELSGDALVYKTCGERYKLEETVEIKPSPEQWRVFWKTCAAVRVWDWQSWKVVLTCRRKAVGIRGQVYV